MMLCMSFALLIVDDGSDVAYKCHAHKVFSSLLNSVLHRFRMLAEHFLTMYPNLNLEVDSELAQLKVRTG